jgi:putative membrane protein
MPLAFWIPAFAAATFHVLAFYMESVRWTSPAVRRRFRQTPEQADTTRTLAFNQGFYNLFLALQVLVGFTLVEVGHRGAGLALATWSCLSMVMASVVLLASARNMARGAALQGIPPLLFLALVVVRSVA